MSCDESLQDIRERVRKAQRGLEEERRLREDEQLHYERRTRKSNLPEFLNTFHTHPCLGLTIQQDPSQATYGDPANATNKPRPNRILPWPEFDTEQAQTWEDIMESNFVRERQFTSLHTLEELGDEEWQRRRRMGSKVDLYTFALLTREDPVSEIIERLFKDQALRNRFGLKGWVKFENHGNTLSPERAAEEINPGQTASAESTKSAADPLKSSRPPANQFCLYNVPRAGAEAETEHRVAALTIEYKAPHKLTLGHIYEGLGEIELDDVVAVGKNESVAIRCRRLIAAVITQGFSYMVHAGVEYGEIYTGEATIFLRVADDPSTVYYSLSVPKGDVGSQTGWSESGDQPNRLHLTAVGQAVAFTLRALQTPPRSTKWRTEALRQLKTWNVVVKEVEDAIPNDDIPSSEYRPSPWANQDTQRSPIQFRPRKTIPERVTCASASSSSNSNDDDHPDPDTPSRPPPPPPNSSVSRTLANATTKADGHGERKGPSSGNHRQRNLGRFCTPQCLMGIIQGGNLDQTCPNIREHGQGRHRLNRETFIQQVQQLLDDQLDYCEELNIHGARGALFKLKLPEFGYTIVAKATGVECVQDLMHESTIYRHLLPIQGKYIPVHLGDIKVDNLIYYAGAVRIVHMMLLSFGRFPIRSPIPRSLVEEAICGLRAIHQLGVLQKDPAARNILVHPERPGTTWIDFERAVLVTPQVILGELHMKRKQMHDEVDEKMGCLEKDGDAAEEIESAKEELMWLVSKK